MLKKLVLSSVSALSMVVLFEGCSHNMVGTVEDSKQMAATACLNETKAPPSLSPDAMKNVEGIAEEAFLGENSIKISTLYFRECGLAENVPTIGTGNSTPPDYWYIDVACPICGYKLVKFPECNACMNCAWRTNDFVYMSDTTKIGNDNQLIEVQRSVP